MPVQMLSITSLLHVRGGVSLTVKIKASLSLSSPRPWRCFCLNGACFLTCWSLLHVRGGVSAEIAARLFYPQSSPRPWRCFLNPVARMLKNSVFSTSVEVFPSKGRDQDQESRLLHVRGGVSKTPKSLEFKKGSSPRPWRCFQLNRCAMLSGAVFSTSVEVFPNVALRGD